MSESNWTSVREKGGYDAPVQSSGKFEYGQRDKPIKAIIGIAVLVILALVFSRMNPAAHDISNAPAVRQPVPPDEHPDTCEVPKLSNSYRRIRERLPRPAIVLTRTHWRN